MGGPTRSPEESFRTRFLRPRICVSHGKATKESLPIRLYKREKEGEKQNARATKHLAVNFRSPFEGFAGSAGAILEMLRSNCRENDALASAKPSSAIFSFDNALPFIELPFSAVRICRLMIIIVYHEIDPRAR